MAKNLILWLIIAAVLLTVFNNFSMNRSTEPMEYSQFVSMYETGQVRKVVIDGLRIEGYRPDGTKFETVRPSAPDLNLIDDLLKYKVAIEGKEPETQSIWTQLLVASFPILVIIAVFMFFIYRNRIRIIPKIKTVDIAVIQPEANMMWVIDTLIRAWRIRKASCYRLPTFCYQRIQNRLWCLPIIDVTSK